MEATRYAENKTVEVSLWWQQRRCQRCGYIQQEVLQRPGAIP